MGTCFLKGPLAVSYMDVRGAGDDDAHVQSTAVGLKSVQKTNACFWSLSADQRKILGITRAFEVKALHDFCLAGLAEVHVPPQTLFVLARVFDRDPKIRCGFGDETHVFYTEHPVIIRNLIEVAVRVQAAVLKLTK